jgi:hypothetical protein
MNAWISPAEKERGTQMIYTNVSNVITGFTSSYAAELALLPKGAWVQSPQRPGSFVLVPVAGYTSPASQ